jgi:hypothetical protein
MRANAAFRRGACSILAGCAVLASSIGASAQTPSPTAKLTLPSGAKAQVKGNRVTMMQGVNISGTYDCACSSTGSCMIDHLPGGVLFCTASTSNGCKGSCDFSTTTTTGPAGAARAPGAAPTRAK